MIRWLRVLLPSLSWFVAFTVLYGSASVLVLCIEWRLGQPLPEDVRSYLPRVFLELGTLSYAAWRAIAFHPLFRPAYWEWLAATPWTSRQSLPLGPAHLVLQDVVFVGSAVLFALLNHDSWGLYLPQVFLAVYLTLLGGSLSFTGAWPWGYAVAFGLGLVVYLWYAIPACLIAALLTYAVAYLGLQWSLAHFPWDSKGTRDLKGLFGRNPNTEGGSRHLVGWPFGQLAPRFPGPEFDVPLHHAFLVSLLAGWWVFAVASLIPDILLLWLGFVVIGVPTCRLFAYCNGYWPPINFRGRLATFRWVIPGYDQVFVAPLLAIGAGYSLETISTLVGLEPLFARPVVIGVVLFTSLSMGPSLKVWRLTGEHRIVVVGQQLLNVKVG